VLYADEYGFHQGNVWYRGRFTATGAEKTISLNAITGRRGIYLVWLDGRYLGSAAGGTESDAEPVNPDPGRGDFTVPEGLLSAGRQATLTVLVENMGHNDDWTADDVRHKQPRGLFGALVDGAAAPITWQIRGSLPVDGERGPMNTGGLHGEREGWHLPGGGHHWGRPPATTPPGVSWYRTAFRLDLPRGHDVSLGLRFDDARPGHRVLIFVNGWNMGQYLGELSPQRDFVLPAGVLREHNTLTFAVIATEELPGGPGPVRLVTLGNHRTFGADR
jgi:hypothetical protein